MPWHTAYQTPENSLRNHVSNILVAHVKITDDCMNVWNGGPWSPAEAHQAPSTITTVHQGSPCSLSTKAPLWTIITDGDISNQLLTALAIPTVRNEGVGLFNITWQSNLKQTDFTMQDLISGRCPLL